MSVPTLKEAYDTAFAVFSPRVEFVEWKMYEVRGDQPGGWWPYYAYKGERLWDTWKEIDSKRWIYVFRRPKGATAAPTVLVDELFLDEKKQLHATPMEKLRAQADASKGMWPERGERGAQIPIGTTACFVRQLLGAPLLHYFFSSRVQLPTKQIMELQKHIEDWTQGITFEPTDPNIIWGREGEAPRLPVLDPITIATHLHAYMVAASDDLIKYLAAIDDPDDTNSVENQKRAKERQKKFLLAHVVSSLLDADGTLVGNESPDLLSGFLDDYKDQVEYRKEWRHRWDTYLANWLRAKPIQLLAEAHQFDKIAEFPEFFLHMAQCHSRLCESPEGRELLRAHFEQPDKFAWVQKYVLGRGMTSDEWQSIRKLGSAPLEFVKEHVPVWMAEDPTKEVAEVLKKMFAPLTTPIQVARSKGTGVEHLGWADWIGTHHGETLKFVEKEKIEVLIIDKAEGEGVKLDPMWKGAVHTLMEGIELIDFALALRAFVDTPLEERGEKIWAFVELTRSGLDLSAATLTLFRKGSKQTIEKLTFVAAVIDVVMGAKETSESVVEGKYGKALGSGIVTAGATMIAAGILVESSLAGPLGLFVMGTGYIIKWIFRDPTDYENFINFSSFGKRKGRQEEKPGWYKTEKTFAEWPDDLDEQLRAAVLLLCKFTIQPEEIPSSTEIMAGAYPSQAWLSATEERLRRATIKMGWVPRDAKLHLKYHEEWVTSRDSRDLTADIEYGDNVNKPKVSSTKLSVDVKSGGILVIQGPKSENPILDMSQPTAGLYGGSGGQFRGVNKSLKEITLTGSLECKLDEVTVSVEGNGLEAYSGDDTHEKRGVLYKPPN